MDEVNEQVFPTHTIKTPFSQGAYYFHPEGQSWFKRLLVTCLMWVQIQGAILKLKETMLRHRNQMGELKNHTLSSC